MPEPDASDPMLLKIGQSSSPDFGVAIVRRFRLRRSSHG